MYSKSTGDEGTDKQRRPLSKESLLTEFPSPGPGLQCVELQRSRRVETLRTSQTTQDGENKNKDSVSIGSVPFWKLFSFADRLDFILIALGTLGACVHGAAIPIFFLVFGRVINAFGAYHAETAKMSNEVSQVFHRFIDLYYFFPLLSAAKHG